jgi:hypothetical protein
LPRTEVARPPYQRREEEGTQSPLQTLGRGWGLCRDFALLFIEAAGFGARLISGYLYNPDRASAGPDRVDPCMGPNLPARCGLDHLRSDKPWRRWFNLIPVAVGRVITQVTPLTGSLLGTTDAYQGMSLEVQVTP